MFILASLTSHLAVFEFVLSVVPNPTPTLNLDNAAVLLQSATAHYLGCGRHHQIYTICLTRRNNYRTQARAEGDEDTRYSHFSELLITGCSIIRCTSRYWAQVGQALGLLAYRSATAMQDVGVGLAR